MTEIVFASPIPRGKEDVDRQIIEEIEGARRDEYVAALKDAGVTREAIWHQHQPDGGTLAIVYILATDPEALSRFTSSDAEISQWFSQQMLEGYGRYLSGAPLPVEQVLDCRV